MFVLENIMTHVIDTWATSETDRPQ